LGKNLSSEEKQAGLGKYTSKNELQSYVGLLSVSNQKHPDATVPRLPTEYNSDPYGVMDPENPDTYMVVKVGNQWGVVGRSDGVKTSNAAVNGILNGTGYAPGLMGVHVNYETQDTSLYTLYYNPTSNNILVDGWETFRDKLGFTTPVAQQLSQVLKGVQQSGKSVNWVAHSQGGGIYSEAVKNSRQDLSKNSVVFHSGANNAIVTDYYLGQTNMNQQRKPDQTYKNSSFDFVPNVLGLNGNPLEMIGSALAIPSLFADPLTSPHTLPPGWKPATGNVQGGRP
jgi:hypothetical protein